MRATCSAGRDAINAWAIVVFPAPVPPAIPMTKLIEARVAQRRPSPTASVAVPLVPARGRVDLEQLDVEDEHARRRPRAAAVGQRLRDPQTALLADHHQLHALGPAGDDAV